MKYKPLLIFVGLLFLFQTYSYGKGEKKATLNVSGGSENVSYYISAGYFGEQGVYKRDGVQSYIKLTLLEGKQKLSYLSEITVFRYYI